MTATEVANDTVVVARDVRKTFGGPETNRSSTG